MAYYNEVALVMYKEDVLEYVGQASEDNKILFDEVQVFENSNMQDDMHSACVLHWSSLNMNWMSWSSFSSWLVERGKFYYMLRNGEEFGDLEACGSTNKCDGDGELKSMIAPSIKIHGNQVLGSFKDWAGVL